MDLEESEAPGDNVKAVAHEHADLGIIGKLVGQGIGDNREEDGYGQKVKSREKVGGLINLLKPVVSFGAVILGRHGGKAEAYRHRDHEG